MHFSEFAVHSYAIGCSLVSCGLVVRRSLDADERRRAYASEDLSAGPTVSGELVRIVLWPLFLWRPW